MMAIQRQIIFSAHKWLYKICETKINVCLNNDSTIIILLIFPWILKSFFLQLASCLWKDSEEFTIADLTRCWPHSRFLQTDLTLFLKELYYGPLQPGCSFSIPKLYLILEIFPIFPVEAKEVKIMQESKYEVLTLLHVFWHNEIYSIPAEWDTCGIFFLKPKTGIPK